MALAKMTIEVKGKAKPIKVLFNPEQIQITRSGYQNTDGGGLAHKGDPVVVSVNLFFDTTLLRSEGLLGGLTANITPSFLANPFSLEDVRHYTEDIYDLTRNRGEDKAPPLCKLLWGRGNVLLQRGVLKTVTKTLTHFLADGTPVRATLNCVFEEVPEPNLQARINNPIDDPVRTVRRGETLSSIATEEFNNPALWRVIAEANQMDNPRQLVPGQSITVPPLRDDRTQR
jgi:Contractile injection system tube protein/LysM domain